MSDFSDRPFVAGSLTGLRAFNVDSMGRLTGPAYGHVFRPGENQAQCHKRQFDYGFLPTFTYLSGYTDPAAARALPSPATNKKEEKHAAGQRGCSCGYYAYFDGGNDYQEPGRVTGIIEGYGVCTVGTRGFRAEKAKLVALVMPGVRRRDYGYPAAAALLCLGNIAFSIRDAAQGRWILLAIAVLASLASGWSTWSLTRRLLRARKAYAGTASVLRNYSDVPRYDTVSVALKAHPLTPPPTPTPETDDDFWTRSAS